MGVKSALAWAFLLTVINAANTSPNGVDTDINTANSDLSHHLILGSRVPGDRQVLQESVVKSSSWFRITTREQTFTSAGNTFITQVQVLDQKTNGNGARAIVISGGPGHNYVTLRFKSKRGHGINFMVRLYAR